MEQPNKFENIVRCVYVNSLINILSLIYHSKKYFYGELWTNLYKYRHINDIIFKLYDTIYIDYKNNIIVTSFS